SVNGDIGDLNRVLSGEEQASRAAHLDMLLTLTAAVGAEALVLPCGAIDHQPLRTLEDDLDLVASQLAGAAERAKTFGVEIWTESLHFFRLCWNIERAAQLTHRLEGSGVRLVMDFSHITASGGDLADYVSRFAGSIAHVHLRDAVPGDIHLSIGNGTADFAGGLRALAQSDYTGHFALELETRDIEHVERPAAAARAASYISALI
ncbi:MAG: sugar phosphate isomerase/epimerase, partial [Mycetocola sp.]